MKTGPPPARQGFHALRQGLRSPGCPFPGRSISLPKSRRSPGVINSQMRDNPPIPPNPPSARQGFHALRQGLLSISLPKSRRSPGAIHSQMRDNPPIPPNPPSARQGFHALRQGFNPPIPPTPPSARQGFHDLRRGFNPPNPPSARQGFHALRQGLRSISLPKSRRSPGAIHSQMRDNPPNPPALRQPARASMPSDRVCIASRFRSPGALPGQSILKCETTRRTSLWMLSFRDAGRRREIFCLENKISRSLPAGPFAPLKTDRFTWYF